MKKELLPKEGTKGFLQEGDGRVLRLIGNTPMIKLGELAPPSSAHILAKLESQNPGGSVKDRIALSMVVDAEAGGRLKPGDTIVEPTSGNTGIGLAMVAAVRGYHAVLVMPENVSREQCRLLSRYGARYILTPTSEGMAGSVRVAQELLAANAGYFMPQQFDNPANPEAHRRTTGPEILEATGGRVDAFVVGVGTGGTITGVGEVLKRSISEKVLVVAVEPARSPLLRGGKAGLHGIQGIGANFIPKVLNRDIIDDIIDVDDDDAYEMSYQLGAKEGLLVGISAGANVVASLEVARRLGKGKVVVTVLPDTGERYLSLPFESERDQARRGAKVARERGGKGETAGQDNRRQGSGRGR